MSNRLIVQTLAADSWVRETVKGIAGKSGRADIVDDICQDLYLILLEKPESELMQVYNSGYIKWYIVRTLVNMVRSPRHPLHKQYAVFDSLPDEVENVLTESADDAIEQQGIRCEADASAVLSDTLQRLYWYDARLFQLWCQKQSCRRISRQTGISHREVLRVINRIKKQIKQEHGNTN